MAAEHRVWGGDKEAEINADNQWMRAQPWYQGYLASIGQRPDNVKLTKKQRGQLLKLAQANGVEVDEGKIEVDPAGNFNPKGHKLRNAVIIGALGAGVAFGAPALASALSSTGGAAGAAGAGASGASGAGAAGAAGAAAPLASTGTVGLASLPSAAGSSLMGAGGSAALTGAAGGGVSLGAMGAGSVMPTAAGSTATTAGAAGGSGSLWGKIAQYGAAPIGNVVGSAISANAQKKAAELEAQAAKEALEWQKQQYGVRQRQLAPAINVGNASTVRLADLMGLSAPNGGAWDTAPPETQPGYVPPPAQAAPRGAPAQRQPPVDMVQVLSPRGTRGFIPRAQLDAALKAGATQVT